MNFCNENGALTLSLTGRIDSANAEATEAEIQRLRTEHPEGDLVFDLAGLEYISSAGLRVVLRTRKREPSLRLINASSEVYEIFDMTGFTEMLPIEKAYRRLSVDGCEVIGQGANGKVYRIDADTIIKVYRDPDSLPDIQRERELARRAFVLGIPTAIPYDVVRVGEGYGSVFELLSAKSFAKIVIQQPDQYETVIPMYVELLKKIHATQVKPEDMPDMREVALGWAAFLKDYLPAEQYEKLYGLVEAVPVRRHMLHGDYHLKNVMLQNGEVLLIDMDTLCQGDSVFEFASIWLAYVGFSELDPQVVLDFLGIERPVAEQIWQKTLAAYFNTEDAELLRRVEDKARVIGYVRLMRRTIRRGGFETETGRRTIEHCRTQLAALIERVDSLSLES